ncbi:MAG: radical SAM protein [Deltaproteobacteria bacterium]
MNTSKRTGFIRSRVVQLHPTLRCNLSCSHCYSSSGPRRDGELKPGVLLKMLERLRSEGYDVASFSGGEPIMYRGLTEVARGARDLGYRNVMISNGLLLSPRRLDAIAEHVDRIAVSLDGLGRTHDRLRGEGTFDRTVASLARLRERRIEFGISHCVTRDSVADLPDMMSLCVESGASLLQLHPLTRIGRASVTPGLTPLGPVDLSRVYLLSRLLEAQAEGEVVVQFDAPHVADVLAQQDSYGVLRSGTNERESLSDLVNPLIVDEAGSLWPLAYGMAPDQCIARAPVASWEAQLDAYRRGRGAPLRALLREVIDRLEPDGFVDWYGAVVGQSWERHRRVESSELVQLKTAAGS